MLGRRSDGRRTSRCSRRRPHFGFSEFNVSPAATAGELLRSAAEGFAGRPAHGTAHDSPPGQEDLCACFVLTAEKWTQTPTLAGFVMRCFKLQSSLLFGLAIGILVAAAAPAAAGDKEFAAVKDSFAKGDVIALNRLSEDNYKKLILPLNQAQLNQVALLAGENLEIESVLKGVKYDKFNDLLLPPVNAKVHERWMINWASIHLLRRLSDERRITDSAVLPYLIGALKHPYQT
jgi:hypothetical protein